MALHEVIEEVREAIASGDARDANEQEAKAWFITPIVEALGWRGRSRVRFEYSPSQGQMRMDYALRSPDQTTVAVIEAKAPGQDLTGHVTQTLNYAFHEGIPLCILTTGVEWWLYLSLEETSAPLDRFFAKLDLGEDAVEELEDRLQSCLGYEAVIDGSARERAKRMLEDRRNEERILAEIPKAWRRLLEKPNDLLIELVQEEVQQELDLMPSEQQVAMFLRDAQSQPTPHRAPLPAPKRKPPIALPGRPPKRPNPAKRPVGFTLHGERYAARTWSDVWLGVAGALYKRHSVDFDRAMQLRGTTRQYIARSEGDLYAARQIGSSPYFAEVNFSAGDCVRRSRELLEIFGYRGDDLEVLEE